MVRRIWFALTGIALLFPAVGLRNAIARPVPAGRLMIVKIVDVTSTTYKFEPATITVHRGDTVRFLQASVVPHNVEFTDAPALDRLGAARVGPYLLARQQKYDIVVDNRFLLGKYGYQCTPHASLGMAGTIIISESR